MEKPSGNVVFTKMQTRQKENWAGKTTHDRHFSKLTKQRLRNISISAAAVLCLGIGAVKLVNAPEKAALVMNHVTTDFEYDETLGRLQFVSNILPESAMVFLETGDSTASVFSPVTDAEVAHSWSQSEPWYEYTYAGNVAACRDGDVMTVVKNREDEYTVRLMHDDGCESVYSGLSQVSVAPYDRILIGETIGQAGGCAAFEYRKDGLSILPVFELGDS